ncbi:MAG: ISNCY family transposase [Rickettsia sp.]|nr:ISNCY family transposase [Rickettsia sp.]
MSIKTRKEILSYIQKNYKQASTSNKSKILDEFIAITNYRRKYAIHLLNGNGNSTIKKERGENKKKYDEATRQALLSIWHAANQICSKRLVPFIPELLISLERFGHLSLPIEIRNRLLEISPATVDRLLKIQRQEINKGISTTRPGSLLKKQIKIRTFADWNDVIPGFLEGDLVAHCGNRTDGSFLNTLVLTDIASSWTEFFPILSKGAEDVIAALKAAQQILPFLLLGLDTDNGSEFINYALLDFCKTQEITFTRSRAYKKNDQAHVEEKNGSIVRRLIGYDRYEGIDAYNALSELYASLRLYVNFFQPSLKLISKKRIGEKVTKKYDKAKTPYQRLLCSSHISEETKTKLKSQYEDLDPVILLKNLEKLQSNFYQYAWKELVQDSTTRNIAASNPLTKRIDSIASDVGNIDCDKANTIATELEKKVTIELNVESINNQKKKC